MTIFYCKKNQYPVETLKEFTLNTTTIVLIIGEAIVKNGQVEYYH